MATEIEIWVRTERTIIREDIRNLEAGGKVVSPSGEDITQMILEKLRARLAGAMLCLGETSSPPDRGNGG